ncbi:MAG: dihydroorotase [Prevotellaceae bacterium]|nr:dihydroorotase [Prevotellaceae bacterium]
MRILITGGTIVNEGRSFRGSVIIENDRIAEITESQDTPRGTFDTTVDATGCYVLPGVIDSHVHFREPGMTHKADIDTESRAAAFGGVTSYFEMPNTNPQTTSQEALDAKFALAKEKSHVNYSFFPGATNDNGEFLRQLDVHRVPGIKLFMGSSTGNMLVDKAEALDTVFALAAEKQLPLMAHCEDTEIINRNMAAVKAQTATDDPDVTLHPQIRSVEACYESSKLGVELAHKHNTHFHIAHITTAKELELIGENVTAEVCVAHLMFADDDYNSLGTKIKCNPAVKTVDDRQALREYIATAMAHDSATVSTDHAPHTLAEKQGGAAKAVSGMPMVQFSLPAMLTLASPPAGECRAVEQVVQLMCHNQARLFGVDDRGFIRKGYKADIVIVRHEPWTVTQDCIQSKCGWSPLEGRQLEWKVEQTICNGHLIYNRGEFDDEYRGEEISFRNS